MKTKENLTEAAIEILANYASFVDYEEEGIDLENAKMLLENALRLISEMVKFIHEQ